MDEARDRHSAVEASEKLRGVASLPRVPGWKRRWHAVGAKRFPTDPALFDNIPGLVRDYVLPGSSPEAPLLGADDTVITLGSCFARELRRYLRDAGSSADNFWIPEGLNNTYALADFMSWCITGKETNRGFRYDTTSDGEIVEWKPTSEHEPALGHIRSAGAFVLTVGLSEIWEDRESGAVFWRGIPEDVFNDSRHRFRTTTVEENERNLVEIIDMLRSVNSTAPIALTLSPVPLKATFGDLSCVVADSVSKATLRVAIANVMRRGLDRVYYWPSFEIVRSIGAHLPWSAYAGSRGDTRHVTRYLVSEIIDAFVQAFFTPEAVEELKARAAAQGVKHAPRALGPRQQERRIRPIRRMRRRLGRSVAAYLRLS